MFEKILHLRDRDGHYIIQIFNRIQISIKHKANFKYKEATEYGVTREKRNPQVIVSLTSFPARIKYTHIAINTLLRQTVKPDKIVLWLAEEQFPNKENDLPENLLRLKDLGLDIMWCEDLRSYKKLLPSLKAFSEDIIVTADDDMYYEQDWLEKLYNRYLEDKNNIYVHRVNRIRLENGEVKKYPQRISLFSIYPEPSYMNCIFGGSGCLYPPHSLSQEIFNMEVCSRTSEFADDFWFWAMAVLNNTKICEVSGYKSNFQIIDETIESALCKEHASFNFMGIYYKIFNAYPKVLENLEEEANNAIKQ